MQQGDVLNGYTLVSDPTNAGGGQSQWAFATRDGRDVFVKLFLSPKYPVEDGPGSDPAKERKRAVCYAFERRHIEIGRRLDPSSAGAGNLVLPIDFFRHEATYVKVMPRVRATVLPDASTLSAQQILVLLRSLAFSLRMLHDQAVVHGDIKPDNVLVEPGGDGLFVSKLIDFDEAYVVGDPPAPDHIVGDPVYYSPELLRYIKRDPRLPADALSTASDMFSLGLLLHRFLTGALPAFDTTNVHYPAEALVGRGALDPSNAPAAFRPVITRMLSIVPMRRPSIHEFVDLLASFDPETFDLDQSPAGPAVGVPGPFGARPTAVPFAGGTGTMAAPNGSPGLAPPPRMPMGPMPTGPSNAPPPRGPWAPRSEGADLRTDPAITRPDEESQP